MHFSKYFTPQEVNHFQDQGMSPQMMQQAVNEVEQEPRQSQNFGMIPNTKSDTNLIKWQLELDSILDKLRHNLRGDRQTWENGNLVWSRPNPEDQKMNDFGIDEIMRIVQTHINRNTILSNYDIDEVNEIMYQFGIRLKNLLYCKYEKMGIKREHYESIVMDTCDAVRSAYHRAIGGGERESLIKMIHISQSENTRSEYDSQGMPMRPKKSVFNPMRWMGVK